MSQNWDKRFLRLAREVATWSKDPSTKVGAVIVDHDRQVVSLGYNGFPPQLDDLEELLIDRQAKLNRTIHAELNAVFNAKRSVKGCTLYTWPFMTCDRCVIHMLGAGIMRYVAPVTPSEIEERWAESTALAKQHILDSGAALVQYSHID